jgi:hypothetical protein
MDIIVDRPQLVRTALLYLNMNFGDLTPEKYEDINSVFYVNPSDELMMEYDKENERVYIQNDHIWSKIQSLFHLDYDDTQSIIKVWLEETYKMGGLTPLPSFMDT